MKKSESAFKIYLIILGIGMFILFAGAGYIYKLEKDDVPDAAKKQNIQSDARGYSHNHTAQDCIAKVEETSKSCARDEVSCIITSKLFLKTCLENPVPEKGFCDGFQKGDEPIKVEAYTSVFCNNHKEIDIVVCMNTFDVVEDYCREKISQK